MSMPILVIGGINMDILGNPVGDFRLRDSNIGRLTLSAGGVGHNIARQLASQGARVELMCVFGDDVFAGHLRAACANEGIGLLHALQLSGRSCSYLAIHDETGDMAVSLNDMELMERLDGPAVRCLSPAGFAACVLDANLGVQALEAAAEHLDMPLIADPVSIAKAGRLGSVLHRLSALKPNLSEAEAMTGQKGPEDAARALLDRGVKQVFVSLGRDGLYFASAAERGYLKPERLMNAPATGAGDAMAAGITMAIAEGLSPAQAALRGLREAEKRLMSNLEILNMKEGAQ